MLVAYPLPGKGGYRYPIRRGSGLFITFKAFGDASIEIISRIVPRFSFFITASIKDACERLGQSRGRVRPCIMRQLYRTLCIVILLAGISATTFAAKKITIHTMPENATIMIDGAEVGNGTYTVKFEKKVGRIVINLCFGNKFIPLHSKTDSDGKEPLYRVSGMSSARRND